MKNHHSWRSEESSFNEEAKNRHSMQKQRLVKALDQSEEQLNNAHETTLRSKSDKSNIVKWIRQDDIAKSSQAKQSSQTRQHCKAKQISNIAKRSRQNCVRIVSKWVNQRKSELNSAWSLEIAITEY